MLKCQVIIDAMEELAPRCLAEQWDNPGLLLGSPAQEVRKIMVCLDVDQRSAQRAAELGCQMMIAHHPVIFHPIKKLSQDMPQGRLLSQLLCAGMAVYAAHTNLDIAEGGVNDVLADLLDLQELSPLAESGREELVKLAVYVPEAQADQVRAAMVQAGAGHIGKYADCTFNIRGQGTFLPLAGTRPFIGRQGEVSHVKEVRIETVLPVRLQKKVVRAMLRAHPYEEAAYDLYPLLNKGKPYGLGRIGSLPESLSRQEFVDKLKQALHTSLIRMVVGRKDKIRKVAVCSGSGAEFLQTAAFAGADAYVTGDVKYHEALQAQALGLNIIDAGHFATEQPVVAALAAKLQAMLPKVEFCPDEGAKDVFEFV